MDLAIIENKIYEIRGQKVMLDFDLAVLYETETKYLKRAVKQNIKKFPSDFMFEITKVEFESLRCSFSTSKRGSIHWPTLDEDLSLKGFLRDELYNLVGIKVENNFAA